MDQDLIAYLDERFGQIDERFGQIDERFGQIDERFGQIDERFGQIDERFGQLETEIRHAHVLLEDLRRDLRGVADGVAAGHESLEQFREEVDRRFEEQNSTLRLYFTSLKRRDDELDSRLSKVEAAVA